MTPESHKRAQRRAMKHLWESVPEAYRGTLELIHDEGGMAAEAIGREALGALSAMRAIRRDAEGLWVVDPEGFREREREIAALLADDKQAKAEETREKRRAILRRARQAKAAILAAGGPRADKIRESNRNNLLRGAEWAKATLAAGGPEAEALRARLRRGGLRSGVARAEKMRAGGPEAERLRAARLENLRRGAEKAAARTSEKWLTLLRFFASKPEGASTADAIASSGLTRNEVRGHLPRLEKQGLLTTRRRSERPGRSFLWSVTPAGLAAIRSAGEGAP